MAMLFLSPKILITCRRMAEAKIVVLIIVWWIASTLTSQFSKDEISITEQSFGNIKWLDLTFLQSIVGCLGSAILLFLFKRRLFCLKIIRSYNSLVAVATNVIGHLSVNVSYAFVSSRVTQVIKSNELLFTLFFVLYQQQVEDKKKQRVTASVFVSIMLMSLGMTFLTSNTERNVYGIVAAVVSSILFPLRNIALKRAHGQLYDGAIEKYFNLSFYGATGLLPLVIFNFFLSYNALNLSFNSITSGTFHGLYNLASISVLEHVTPLNHALLNFCKRLLEFTFSIRYFNVLPWQMVTGYVIVFFWSWDISY